MPSHLPPASYKGLPLCRALEADDSGIGPQLCHCPWWVLGQVCPMCAGPDGGRAGGWEGRKKEWFGDMAWFLDLDSGNMLEKHLCWVWRFFICHN